MQPLRWLREDRYIVPSLWVLMIFAGLVLAAEIRGQRHVLSVDLNGSPAPEWQAARP